MGRFDIFEYAGKSSSIYNLVSCEINKDYQNIISGAEYEPTVDTLPHSANQLLLGLDYSDKPLEFDLEIINPLYPSRGNQGLAVRSKRLEEICRHKRAARLLFESLTDSERGYNGC